MLESDCELEVLDQDCEGSATKTQGSHGFVVHIVCCCRCNVEATDASANSNNYSDRSERLTEPLQSDV